MSDTKLWDADQNTFKALLPLLLRYCCGFVAGLTSISSRIYRDVADVAGREGGKGGYGYTCY